MAKRAQIADRSSPGAFLFNMNHAAKTFGFRFLRFGPVIDYTAERDVFGYAAIEKRHCRGNSHSGQRATALDRKKRNGSAAPARPAMGPRRWPVPLLPRRARPRSRRRCLVA